MRVFNLNHFQELKDENGRLFRQLSEKEYQIKQLKARFEEEKSLLIGTGT